MKNLRSALVALLAVLALPSAFALEKQPAAAYHARRVALADKVSGGIAILFAAPEAQLDLMPYRQDEDFYYLTGWDEPGAALMIVPADAATNRPYREVLYLPSRNLRLELYTGVKLDAATPGASQTAGVDAVEPMTALASDLNQLLAADRRLAYHLWTQHESTAAQGLVHFINATLGNDTTPPTADVTAPVARLRLIKDAGEIALMQKATDASIAAQRVMMQAVHPGATELAVAGQMYAAWMAHGCERASYAPIVGSGPNSTTLHYSANSRTIQDGDLVNVDAACEFSMYASDITRTVPANGHFTARQREIYNIVLGAQRAAIEAFVAGKSTINDRDRHDPNSLDTAAYNYINTHGKDLHGDPLGKYWLHGLGHMIGINVHDPGTYPEKLVPGMFFTIEPGIYIPEEHIGIRLECVFLVGNDGKLIDIVADLPHTPEEIEAAMKH